MNQGNPPPYSGPGPTAPYPPYPQPPMGPEVYPPGPMGGPYPPPQGYPYQGYPQYGWQGGPQEPPKTTEHLSPDRAQISNSILRKRKSDRLLPSTALCTSSKCMWWKTKEGMTWAHLPASQPAGLLSVVAVSGTCSPDLPGPAVLPTLLPPPGVTAPISSDR
uniref:Cysteine-rich and transmembrane domain-containing protein 1 n=1 Tax=Molossus molossus TaxID=27622 RepID=A0A7J8I629_MOLMO|nr:cysteine rich transmembrane module containing 1 [Molossus molossus]